MLSRERLTVMIDKFPFPSTRVFRASVYVIITIDFLRLPYQILPAMIKHSVCEQRDRMRYAAFVKCE